MKRPCVLVCTMILLTFSAFSEISGFSNVNAQPRSDLEITWYSDSSLCYSALKDDLADITAYPLTHEQFENAQTNPDIQLASYDENGILEIDVNNNYSISDNLSVRSPTNEIKVRQAIAHLINKSYIIEEFLPDFCGNNIDVPISNSLNGWWNSSVVGDNYPYPYAPQTSANLLASLGFNDTDGNGWLNYPVDWPGIYGADTTVYPLSVIYPLSPEERKLIGDYLVSQLEVALGLTDWPEGYVGGGFKCHVTNDPFIYRFMLEDRNYHVYVSGWSLIRFPPMYMYYMFHSDFWYPLGYNLVTGKEYPELDEELEKAYNARDISTAMFHCRNVQGFLVNKCVSIWLLNYRKFNAYRKEIPGVVSQQEWGLDNQYTYLNAYRADNPSAPIRLGVGMIPEKLNPLYSMWYGEWQMLDRIYPTLLSVNPYFLELDQPWVAQDWEIDKWFDFREGKNKTKVTFWLRKNVGCAEPRTGNLVDYLTTDDVEFSLWYTYAFDDAWAWDTVMDVNHIRIITDYQIEVCFDSSTIWEMYSFSALPLLGPKNNLIEKLCEEASATFTGADLVEVASGYFEYQFTPDQVVQVINASVNGEPIYEGTDFYIRAGYDVFCHNVFVNLTSFAPTDVITINYYRAIPDGAAGIYLGGNLGYDWTDTMYSYGMFYPVSISAASAVLNKNPWFFLETPPLGEIDWRWTWTGTTKPRSGYYQINILDVVFATGAYCTRGDGTYNPVYMPGADLDANDLCHIGILDLVLITGHYAEKFGTPPDP